jgi:EAL domain-containing protein (putative c-di-GMP-specific phosphodiesterase class I)
VVQLLDYNVDYAQGFLFGEPRAVREDNKPTQADSTPVVQFRKAG